MENIADKVNGVGKVNKSLTQLEKAQGLTHSMLEEDRKYIDSVKDSIDVYDVFEILRDENREVFFEMIGIYGTFMDDIYIVGLAHLDASRYYDDLLAFGGKI